MFNNISNGEVDDGKGEGAYYETDTGVEDSFFSFFYFGGFTVGGNVIDATDDNEGHGD